MDLPAAAFEYVQSIEAADEAYRIIRVCTGLLTSRERSKKTEGVFLGALRGFRGEIRNPPGLVFFLSLFLLEKQKKKWNRTRKFAEDHQLSAVFPHTPKRLSPEEDVSLLHTPVMLQLNYKRREPLDERGRMR